ncbi:MAG TPA: M20/M25/M40 family metallo-hydrolase [Pyrinomonadaceae bacterium]|nr:M20/M25/M40 family metallo-hydrolase [Pyrinomonadaceae bacterium]
MKTKSALQTVTTVILLTILLPVAPARSQAPDSSDAKESALASWVLLDGPPGWEQMWNTPVLKAMPGWQRDELGNLMMRKGSGSPRRVVACAMDRPGFAVTEITESGYLRLREAGVTQRAHPLWVQFHEGQRIRVLTRAGGVPGVVTVRSTHLQRGRAANAPPATLDDLWVDVGATSRSEVKRLGIQMLDPVVRDLPPWFYADFVSGPAAGLRVGCAAVASAARGQVISGETIFLLTTLRSFGQDGLEAALHGLGRIDELTVIEPGVEANANGGNSVGQRRLEKPAYLPESSGLTALLALAPRVRFAGSLVESVALADAENLLAAVEKASGVAPAEKGNQWVALPNQAAMGLKPTQGVEPLSHIASLLKSLADIPAVSGHERPVRETITRSLPSWAQQKLTTDKEGNLVLEVGPERNPVMFIAHQDEVGFEITNIANDGTVSLRNRGGLFLSLWEGQPALLHFDQVKEPLRGVFVARETATSKQPEGLTAWFGVDGAELKRQGVTIGQSITAYKNSTRLGSSRFTARALDDRAGSTALILAASRINPALLQHKVIFAWSVREETGLEGALALAKRYGASIKRVYSIDTFVSSDSPAETTRFADTPLGQGAVIRGLDNSSVVPPAELDRITSLAAAQRIPLQVGATNGGTDGSQFSRYGAVNISLSWPGRYSHSPVEVLDLRDLQALQRLISALAAAP